MLTLVKLGFAQTNNEFQLTQTSDNFYKECFRNSNRIEGNRPDMIYCINLEYQQRDKTLNQVYQQLRLQLSNTSKELLKDAQLKWISFRDKENMYFQQISFSKPDVRPLSSPKLSARSYSRKTSHKLSETCGQINL